MNTVVVFGGRGGRNVRCKAKKEQEHKEKEEEEKKEKKKTCLVCSRNFVRNKK